MQNHGLGMDRDEICEDSITTKSSPDNSANSADLPKLAKGLGYY